MVWCVMRWILTAIYLVLYFTIYLDIIMTKAWEWEWLLTLRWFFCCWITLRLQTLHNPLQSSGWLGNLTRQNETRSNTSDDSLKKKSHDDEYFSDCDIWRCDSAERASRIVGVALSFLPLAQRHRCRCNVSDNQKKEKNQVTTTCSSSRASRFTTASELVSSARSSRSLMFVTLRKQTSSM